MKCRLGSAYRCLALVLVMLGIVATAAKAEVQTPATGSAAGTITIDSRLEPLVDQYLIDRLDHARLVLQQPKDEGAVLKFDQPWESPFAGCLTVIKDGPAYRLFYRGMYQFGDTEDYADTCYAESKEGLQWTKPNLGLFEVRGSRHNNCVYADDPPFSHNFTPFLDTRPGGDPQSRYKAVSGLGQSGLWLFASSDGIHWKKLGEKPILTEGAFDSQNVAFWSETEGKYLCYFRTWKGKEPSWRWISRATSDDLVSWSKPEEMVFLHDGQPAPPEHLYINTTHPYFRAPHIYLSLPFRFLEGRRVVSREAAKRLGVHEQYSGDCSDVVFMTSRGGNVYDRTFLESFIRPGIGLENWVSRTNMPAMGVVPTGEHEMSLYVLCNYAQPTAYLRRYSLRLDGFASVHAPYEGGEMLTKPLVFRGKHLQINYSTSAAGQIQVEVLDAQGRPLPGRFLLDDCQTIVGDEIVRKVAWRQSGDDLSELAGQPIRLRFVMKDADLFSIQFCD